MERKPLDLKKQTKLKRTNKQPPRKVPSIKICLIEKARSDGFDGCYVSKKKVCSWLRGGIQKFILPSTENQSGFRGYYILNKDYEDAHYFSFGLAWIIHNETSNVLLRD